MALNGRALVPGGQLAGVCSWAAGWFDLHLSLLLLLPLLLLIPLLPAIRRRRPSLASILKCVSRD